MNRLEGGVAPYPLGSPNAILGGAAQRYKAKGGRQEPAAMLAWRLRRNSLESGPPY